MAMLKLTQEGTRNLEKELQYLLKRKKQCRNTSEKEFIHKRVFEIKDILAQSIIWPMVREAGYYVEPGSTVTIEDTVHRERYTYTIVHPFEADPRENMISVESPIAKAAIGKTVHSTFTVRVPFGEDLTYTILDIQNC